MKEFDSKNIKALYWGAYSLEKQEKHNEALELAKIGIEVEPDNKEMKNLYNQIKKKVEFKNNAWKQHMNGIYNTPAY